MVGFTSTGDAWYLNRLKWVVEDWWKDNFVPVPPSREFSCYDTRGLPKGADPRFMTQFRIPQDSSKVVDVTQGRVEVESPTGNKMIIKYDKQLIDDVKVFSGQTEDRISVDTAGWRKVKPVQTLGFWWKGRANTYPVKFEIELLPKELDERASTDKLDFNPQSCD